MERVVAALKGEEGDRRAFTMTLSLYGARLSGCTCSEYYTDPTRYARGQQAVVELCRPDIIFTPFALALEAAAFGSEIIFLPKFAPNVRKPCVRNPAEIGSIRLPDLSGDRNLQYITRATRLLVERYKGSIPICGILTAPVDLPAIIMGIDNWLELLLFDEEKAKKVLSITGEYFVVMANSMFREGIDFLAMALVCTSPKILLEKTIRDLIIPALSDLFKRIEGPLVLHHGGNPLSSCLHLCRGLPNVAAFALDHRDTFSAARAIVGNDVLLLGNLDGPSLGRLAPGLAVDKARAILEDRRHDRRYIFATSAADVPWDTPTETMQGIYELVQGY
jgi:uroporphyrinogen decarboxylase